jgi:hypothetical protein
LLSLYIPFRRLFYKLTNEKKILRPLCGPFLKIIISRQCRAAQQPPLCISQRPATCYIIMLLIIIMMIIAGSVIATPPFPFYVIQHALRL